MESGDLNGLESILQNLQISNSVSGPERTYRVFKEVKGLLTYTMGKLTQENLQQTQYTDINVYIESPSSYYVEMDLPIKLNFPDITPVGSDKGLIYLKACNVPNPHCPFVSPDGYIRCDSVRNYINIMLQAALASSPSGWSMQLIHGRHGHTQTIEAKSEVATVYMNFIPAFELHASQWPLAAHRVGAEVSSKFPWFAVPWQNPVNNDNLAFMAYAPFWLTEILKGQPNIILFLNLLMSWHAKRAKDLPNFSAYNLKSFMLQYVLNNRQWDVGLDQLVEIMPQLLVKLNSGRIDSFLVKGQNMLECMSVGEIQQCLTTFQDLYAEAPYDKQEFWTDLLERVPDARFWFSIYVSIYSKSNIIIIK